MWVAAGQPAQPAAMHALQSRVTHESGDPFATNSDVQTQPQLGVHAWGAIGPAAAGAADELDDLIILVLRRKEPARIASLGVWVAGVASCLWWAGLRGSLDHGWVAARLGKPRGWLLG